MRFTKNQKIKIGKHTFYVRVTNRAIIEYEELSGDKKMDFSTVGNMLKFFYCIAKAGARDEKKPFDYTYDQFLNLIDEYFSETMEVFNEAMTEVYGNTGEDVEKKKLVSQ